MLIHKKCGSEIEEWKHEDNGYWHPFFVGYCPICDFAVTKREVEKPIKRCVVYNPHGYLEHDCKRCVHRNDCEEVGQE